MIDLVGTAFFVPVLKLLLILCRGLKSPATKPNMFNMCMYFNYYKFKPNLCIV